MKNKNIINLHAFVVGCGLTGMVIARTLADYGIKVTIYERRKNIAGNMYDFVDESGFLVQKYGPHAFFTSDRRIRPYVERYTETEDCFPRCRTVIGGNYVPMPFNFQSLSIIYSKDKSDKLKKMLINEFKEGSIVSVTDLLDSKNSLIKEYGQYMYEHEYKLYTAKQWGRNINDISPDIFKRVPVYISDFDVYQYNEIQFMPKNGFTKFSEELINHLNIEIKLGIDPIKEGIIRASDDKLIINENLSENDIVIFTGEIDYLLDYRYGRLPYRSLEFVWKTIYEDEFQPTEIVAYPEAEKITRVTEYKKLPTQNKKGITRISIELPFEYNSEAPVGNEPYYPIKNDDNMAIYDRYVKDVNKIDRLYVCGRLGDYRYYNMDMAIIRAWGVAEKIIEKYK